MSEHNQNNLVPQEEQGESSAVACRPELNGLPNEVLLIIIKLVREHGKRAFFKLRRVHPRWNDDIFPMFTEKIITLCFARAARIAKCSFDSFYDNIEPDTAVDIRLRSLARDYVATLVDRYPSVTQLIIIQSRLVLATNWHQALTHLSLYCNCNINQDPSVVINTITSLQYLDMKNYHIEVLDNMGPTLGRVEHLSFDNHRADCLPRGRQGLNRPNLEHLAFVMGPNCKRFWISNLTKWIANFNIWHESNPRWLAGITHFALDLNDGDRDYEKNWLNQLCECMPSLQVLHTKGKIGNLDPAMVNKIGQLAHLWDIRINVTFQYEQLLAAFTAVALTPWTAVRNMELTMDQSIPIKFLRIVSAIVSNIEHLTFYFVGYGIGMIGKVIANFVDDLPNSLLSLKLYELVNGYATLKFTVKRGELGIFETVLARTEPMNFSIWNNTGEDAHE